MNIIDTASLAAGASINVLQGKQYEFLPFDSQTAIALNGSAAGLVVTVYAGSDLVQQEGPALPLNRFAVWPDDFMINVPIAQGTRLSVTVRNTTAGALTWFFTARLQQL